MKELIERFLKDEDGATMVEYVMMAAFIAAVCVFAVARVGISVESLFRSYFK